MILRAEDQYEVGKEYEEKGKISCCYKGFHACKVPLDVFGYYEPTDANGNLRRYAVVEQSGDIDEKDDKTSSSKIKIKSEISIMDLVKFHVNYVKENTDKIDKNTGNWSASTNTGDRSASTNTGDWSASTNTGNRSASTNTGNYSRASVTLENSAAFAFGYKSKAMAEKGWIIIVDWREDGDCKRYIKQIYTAKVGQKIKNRVIKPNTWYWFENGKLKSETEK